MTALVYQGQAIRRQGEMLSLTDMWRAAGEPVDKRPAEWARYQGASFIAFLSETLNMGSAHILRTERGTEPSAFDMGSAHIKTGGRRGGGGTWGHWQVAIAYAKYLSHAFHAWCNDVVRAHMEGLRAPPQAEALESYADSGLRDIATKARLVEITERLKGPVAAWALWQELGLPVAIPQGRATRSSEAAMAAPAMAALVALAQEVGSWTGTAGDLLATLTGRTAGARRKGAAWPATSRALTNLIEDAEPALHDRGITIEKRRTMHARLIEIAYNAEA